MENTGEKTKVTEIIQIKYNSEQEAKLSLGSYYLTVPLGVT